MISCDYGIVIPVRGGSVRLPRKNALPFGPASSLLEWKIEQLLKIVPKERIYVSTEDAEFKRTAHRMKVNIHDRDPYLSEGSTSFHEVIYGVVKDIPHQHIAWCPVTSPLMTQKEYSKCFEAYEAYVIKGKNDSLIGMNLLKEFLWDEHTALNYNIEHHIFTQQLPNIYRVTNSIHIRPKKDILQTRYFIGMNPYKQILSKLAGIDIDEMEDYRIAQALYPLYLEELKPAI